jgi:hypothetical protein
MQAKKIVFDFVDFCMTIICPKRRHRHNDNDQYEYWSDESKSLYERYLEK